MAFLQMSGESAPTTQIVRKSMQSMWNLKVSVKRIGKHGGRRECSEGGGSARQEGSLAPPFAPPSSHGERPGWGLSGLRWTGGCGEARGQKGHWPQLRWALPSLLLGLTDLPFLTLSQC